MHELPRLKAAHVDVRNSILEMCREANLNTKSRVQLHLKAEKQREIQKQIDHIENRILIKGNK